MPTEWVLPIVSLLLTGLGAGASLLMKAWLAERRRLEDAAAMDRQSFIGFLKSEVNEARVERAREREERQLWREVISDSQEALRFHSEQEKDALDDLRQTLRELVQRRQS